jgi:hypothetical protein
MQTWSRIDSLFGILEEAIRPEVNPKDLFQLANEYFRWERFPGMIHHFGHGIGPRAAHRRASSVAKAMKDEGQGMQEFASRLWRKRPLGGFAADVAGCNMQD